MTTDPGLYRLYEAGSDKYQDFEEHERAGAILAGWCEVPNTKVKKAKTEG